MVMIRICESYVMMFWEIQVNILLFLTYNTFRLVKHTPHLTHMGKPCDIYYEYYGEICTTGSPGTHPTNGISIEFKCRKKVAVLWFKGGTTDHKEILHKSWQSYCRDKCKAKAKNVMYKSIASFHWISISIKLPLVWWVRVSLRPVWQ